MTTLTLNNFRSKMIAKAKKRGGIWENFGQDELEQLKVKYKFNPYANQWSNKREWDVQRAIVQLDGWCSNFDLSQLN